MSKVNQSASTLITQLWTHHVYRKSKRKLKESTYVIHNIESDNSAYYNQIIAKLTGIEIAFQKVAENNDEDISQLQNQVYPHP